MFCIACVMVVSNASLCQGTVFHVDVNSTNPVPPFTSWSTAALTIQNAVDLAAPGSLILVNDGVYQAGVRTLDGFTTNRLAVTNAVTIQSVNGAAATIIDGMAAVRCVYLADGAKLVGFTLTNGLTSDAGGGAFCSSTNATLLNCVLINNSAGNSGAGVVSGSLFNCAVLGNTVSSYWGSGGGLSSCLASNCVIGLNYANYGAGGAISCTLDRCQLTNNGTSGWGGGANGSTLEACTLTGNGAGYGGGGAIGSTLTNCVISGNVGENNGGGGALDCTLNNCTLVGNGSYGGTGGADGCTLNNCILYFNGSTWGAPNFSDCVMNFSCTTPLPTNGVGNITNDPLFVDEPGGDFRLQSDSPCINTGANTYVTSAVDLDGNQRIVQGTVDMGAYEFQSLAPFVLIQSDYENTLPGVPLNFSSTIVRGNVSETSWDFGDGTVISNQLTVSHSWAWAGNFPVIFSAAGPDGVGNATSMVHVASAQIQPAAQTVTVGDDASFTISSEVPQIGWQWMFNGTNIPGANTNALTLSGVQTNQAGNYSALVTLNPPTGYTPGQFAVATSNALLNILPLVANLTLYVDVNGTNAARPYADWSTAALTIQDAVHAAQPGALILVNDGVYTNGTQTADGITTNRVTVTKALTIQSFHGPVSTAIDGGGVDRCVYLADGATLTGFTLTNGFSPANGGGAYGATSNSMLSNCVITGCSAASGGGLYGGQAVNSIIASCSSSASGGGVYGSTLNNCLIKNNLAASNGGGAAAATLMGCEVMGNTAGSDAGGLDGCVASYCTISGNTAQLAGGANNCTLVNCIVSGNLAQVEYTCCQAAGGGVAYGTATACVIQGNTAVGNGGGAWGGVLDSCIVEGNNADWGGGTWGCVAAGSLLTGNFAAVDAGADFRSGMVDCTIVNNYSDYGGAGGVDGSNLYNCIDYLNLSADANGFLDVPSNGVNASFNYCCTTPMPSTGGGNITNTPTFLADGFHLTANSPCRGAGNLASTRGLDVDGLPWLNPPSIGCAEYYTNAVPTIALQADYTNVLVGYPLNLKATVIGEQAASLMWNFGDSSADGSGLTTSHAWSAPGDYTVLVTAFFSGTPITAIQTVVIHVATNNTPAILTQPADQTVTEGGAAQFTVAASGSPVLAYQWQFNGTNIPGATNTSLPLFYIQTNQAGLYSVVVLNPLYNPPGQIISSNAVLTVNLPVCSSPPQGMTAWWRAEGNFTDVVDGNNGVNHNVTFTNGKVGQAFVFNHGVSSISVPASPTLNIGGGSGLSIECWIQPDAFALGGAGAPIVEWDAGTTNYVQFWAGGTLFASVVDGNGISHTLQSGPGLLDTNHLQHVAFTYDVGSGAAAIYVNGNMAATGNIGTVPPQTDCAVNIGWSASTTNYFGGLMDELSIYNRALLPSEIMAIFNAEYAGKCSVPVSPAVVLQPKNLSALPGAGGEFDVIAAGTVPLQYQWLLNGNPINGATNASLLVSNAICSQDGSLYAVSVSNAGGSVVSSNAVLTIINTPPQISSISNQVVSYSAPFVAVQVLVSDPGLPASTVELSGASSNTNLIPNGQIVFNGVDTNRMMTLTANSNSFGVATISVIATGPCGATNQVNFNLVVTNFPPQISSIANQHVPLNAALGPLAFTVSDLETPAGQLTVRANSSNNNLISTNQIVLGGTATNRTVTILPGTNGPGTATVTLTVSDPLGASASTSFSVTLDQFTQIALGLPPLTYSAVAWGDYDNDGRLDLLVSGTTNGAASGAITRIYHNDSGIFTNFVSLTNLYMSAVAWVDYDRDGRLDLIVSGLNSSNFPVTQLYHNNGDGTFKPVNADFAGTYNGTLAWGDFDNDGLPDLYLSGLIPVGSQTTNIAKLYRNNGDGTFTDMNLNLLTADNHTAGPNRGTAAWGDFDNDGRQDLLLVGSINNRTSVASIYRNLGGGVFTNVFNSPFNYSQGGSGAWGNFNNDGLLDVAISGNFGYTAIYSNNGNDTFTRTSLLNGVNTPSVAWGDFNNDGYPDLLVGGGPSLLYRNNGGSSFTSSGIALPAILNGALAWGDFNNDGNLDLLFAGSSTTIYRNNNMTTNTPPAAPTSLVTTLALTNTVFFTWAAPLDAQSVSNGLSYNLRVGTTPHGIDVVSPLADPTNGKRRVVAPGNVGLTNRALLINVHPGTYYWSVQVIDTAFAGSPFATEASFTILPSPVANPDTISTASNTPVSIAAANLTLNDVDPNGYRLTVISVISNSATKGSVSLSNGVVTYTPPNQFMGNDAFSYMISDGQSAPATGNVLVMVGGGWLTLNVVSGPAIVNGNFVVWMTGIPGLTYTIEASSNANGPWAKVQNVTAPTTNQGFGMGAFEFFQPLGGNTAQFYRLVYPPF